MTYVILSAVGFIVMGFLVFRMNSPRAKGAVKKKTVKKEFEDEMGAGEDDDVDQDIDEEGYRPAPTTMRLKSKTREEESRQGVVVDSGSHLDAGNGCGYVVGVDG